MSKVLIFIFLLYIKVDEKSVKKITIYENLTILKKAKHQFMTNGVLLYKIMIHKIKYAIGVTKIIVKMTR